MAHQTKQLTTTVKSADKNNAFFYIPLSQHPQIVHKKKKNFLSQN